MQTRFLSLSRVAAVSVGALFLGVLTAGCHDQAPPAAPPNVVTLPPAAPVAVPGGTTVTTPPGNTTVATSPDTKINTNAGPGTSNRTDTTLADKVNLAIVHNKQMTGSRVEPVATGGVVTLTGQVQNQQQKALAEKTARQAGAASVKNKLLIVTTGGAKPKPMVVTKIKTRTVIVHDKSAPAPPGNGNGGADNAQPPAPPAAPAMPNAPNTPAAPATSDNGSNP